MLRTLTAVCLLVFLSACGGGGGGGGGGTTTPPPVLTNFATVTVDAGPAALNTGPNAYTQDNVPYVSVTLCAPGTTNCQTIDHVEVDTGSVGLRIFQSVLNTSLLTALPNQTDTSGNSVGECYGYVDGYVFGSVRQADFQIGGESVSNMPLQVINDSGPFSNAPSSCTSGGGTNLNTVSAFGANGVIGIGATTTDCGTSCTITGGSAAAIYYDCPSSGCGSIITRNATTVAPFQQLPNPVAAMAIDNNGTIISLPSVMAAGQSSVTGTLYFGIGTQTNNGLGNAKVLTTTSSSSPNGSGLITAIYNNTTLDQSFVDSGSNLYLFVDSSIAGCTQTDFKGYYCPASTLQISPTMQGLNGATANVSIGLGNAQTLLNTTNAAIPGLGGNPNVFSDLNSYPNSFDFGLPFFYGRKVYTGIEGRAAGSATGPFLAF